MAERVYVHIGLPKTATTYLQTIVWGSREELLAQGLLIPGRRRSDHLWSSSAVRDDPRLETAIEEHRTAWERLRTQIAEHEGDALVTHEFFASASTEQVQRMVEDLAPAEVHVVVTVRELLGVFTASWQESLKNRGTTPVGEYSTTEAKSPRVIWNWRTLDHRLVLERWSGAVAPERIHVLPVDTTAPRDDIWRRFAGVLGVDPDAVDLDQSFPNESMGVVQAELLLRVNRRLADRGLLVGARDRGRILRTFLADERLVPTAGERFWPPADRVEECRTRNEAALAHLRAHPYDVVGRIEALEFPDPLPQRRTAGEVSDAEVAELAADLVATLLEDVRELRARPRPVAPPPPPPLWRRALNRLRPAPPERSGVGT